MLFKSCDDGCGCLDCVFTAKAMFGTLQDDQLVGHILFVEFRHDIRAIAQRYQCVLVSVDQQSRWIVRRHMHNDQDA